MKFDLVLDDIKKLIPSGSSPAVAFKLFVEHFHCVDVEGCDKGSDGDMLLFEWGGPYSWDQQVSVGLTRQFSFNDPDGDYEGMKHLRIDFKYLPEALEMDNGNKWLEGSEEQDVQSVLGSRSFSAIENLNWLAMEIALSDV